MAKLLITYTKSSIGYNRDQKATIRSLGLHKLNSKAIQNDTPAIRGMIFKVQHLVKVEEVGDTATAVRASATRRPIVRPPAPTPVAPVAVDELVVVDDLADELVVADNLADDELVAADDLADADDLAASDELAAVDGVAASDDELVAADDLAADDDLAASDDLAAVDGVAAGDDLAAVDGPAADADLTAGDDLAVIEGIGPKIAGVLREAGINTFAQLAATDVAQLTTILQDANLRLAVPESWPEQAELAAAGNWDGLKELQDRLKGGRRE